MDMTISALTATFDCVKQKSLGLSPGDSSVVIKFPVGPAAPPRCRNYPDDVRTVQQARNRFTPLDGGPVEPLKVDGIFGPKTKAAIYHFQQKWGIKPPGWKVPDNIVDPEGKTIKRLRAGGGTIPNLPAEFADRIPRVLQIVSAARAAVLSAKTSYTLPSGSLFGKAALERADRHFRVTKTKDPLRRLEEIDSIFLNMQTAIGYVPMGIILAADEPPRIASGVIMFAYDNGYWRREADQVSSDGLHYGSIYLCPKSRELNQESFAYAMIHEMGHYVPQIGLEITDNSYYHKDPQKYARLDPEKAYRNADCYAQFAFDAIGKPGYKVY
jgi:hypothetical protein